MGARLRRVRGLLVGLALAAFTACNGGAPAYAAQAVPPGAVELLPVLVEQQRAIWPDAPVPSFLAGQIEQESCISLRHRKCWNPRAELKTSRENGIGLGQFTRAYRADGSIRFDTIKNLSNTYESLRDWSWETRYDARYQITALVEMDKGIYERQRNAADELERLKFTLSAYNGGEAGLLQDRMLCRNTTGCDPARWTGNVALHSLKSKRPQSGYGQSFFSINREYVANVLELRRYKYASYFEDSP